MDAESLGRALKGRRNGSGWLVRCPVHDDRSPSLSLSDHDGRLLAHCHAGCDQNAVFRALRRVPAGEAAPEPRKKRRDVAPDTARAVREIWAATAPAEKTLAEHYLRQRGITIPIPPTLRFHPKLRHPNGGRYPAMVAAVAKWPSRKIVALHRIWLVKGLDPQKAMLGPCKGAAVRLGPVQAELLVAEGIETALAISQIEGKTAWAALSAQGLESVRLPKEASILIAGDNDSNGAGQGAVHRLIKRIGLSTTYAWPSEPDTDWNDALATGETPTWLAASVFDITEE